MCQSHMEAPAVAVAGTEARGETEAPWSGECGFVFGKGGLVVLALVLRIGLWQRRRRRDLHMQ